MLSTQVKVLFLGVFSTTFLFGKSFDCSVAPEVITTFCEIREAIKKNVDPFFIGYFSNDADLNNRNIIAEDAAKAAMAAYCDSKKDAEKYANALIPVLIKRYIVDQVAEKVAKDLQNKHSTDTVQVSFQDRLQIRNLVEAHMGSAIDQYIQKRNKISPFSISSFATQIVIIYKKNAAHLASKKDSAASKSADDIHEIYPDFDVKKTDGLERNKLFFTDAAKARRESLREAECPICSKEFKDIGKRVNLFCGHSVCPTCLVGQLHIHNSASCPLCRAAIDKQEFGLNVLRRYINCEQLKEQNPHISARMQADCGCK